MKVADETYREDCMVCGAAEPPGHVVVHDESHRKREGRVCSSHTFWEVMSHSSDRFMVEITVTTTGVEMIERVHRKRGLLLPAKRKRKAA